MGTAVHSWVSGTVCIYAAALSPKRQTCGHESTDRSKRFTNGCCRDWLAFSLAEPIEKESWKLPLAKDSQAFASLLLQQNALQMVSDKANQLMGYDNWT